MKPKCILTMGITGAGKSAIGQKIAKEKGYAFLDKDTITTGLVELILSELSPLKDKRDRESSYYIEQIRPLAYESILKTAFENIELGNSVIIAADFHQEMSNPDFLLENEYMEAIRKIADVIVVEVTVDHQTLLKRLITRNEERDAWKIANWKTYVNQVANNKIMWSIDTYTHHTYDNSDALPILQEMKFTNLLTHM